MNADGRDREEQRENVFTSLRVNIIRHTCLGHNWLEDQHTDIGGGDWHTCDVTKVRIIVTVKFIRFVLI